LLRLSEHVLASNQGNVPFFLTSRFGPFFFQQHQGAYHGSVVKLFFCHTAVYPQYQEPLETGFLLSLK
jgi:hypothetical protein